MSCTATPGAAPGADHDFHALLVAAFRAQIERNLREWTEIAERLNLSVEG